MTTEPCKTCGSTDGTPLWRNGNCAWHRRNIPHNCTVTIGGILCAPCSDSCHAPKPALCPTCGSEDGTALLRYVYAEGGADDWHGRNGECAQMGCTPCPDPFHAPKPANPRKPPTMNLDMLTDARPMEQRAVPEKPAEQSPSAGAMEMAELAWKIRVNALSGIPREHSKFIPYMAQGFQSLVDTETAKLERENFSLAAHQCKAFYGDDHGNGRCRIEDERDPLRKQVQSLAELVNLYETGMKQTPDAKMAWEQVRVLREAHKRISEIEPGSRGAYSKFTTAQQIAVEALAATEEQP